MKKIISLLLVLCLMSLCAFALAANSKGTGGGTVIPDAEDEAVVTLAPAPAAALAMFEALGEGESVLTPFAPATQDAARALCATADNMSLIEMSGVAVDADLYQGGPLDVTLDYDEDFSQFANVLVVLSANGAEQAAAPEITEEGDLKIQIAEDFVKNILADAEAFVAVLAE